MRHVKKRTGPEWNFLHIHLNAQAPGYLLTYAQRF